MTWLSWVILVLLETLTLLFQCFLVIGYCNNFFFHYTCNLKLFFINAMDQSEFKTESACVCGKCCSAAFPFFSISNYEFKALYNIISAVDENRYDEYVSLS